MSAYGSALGLAPGSRAVSWWLLATACLLTAVAGAGRAEEAADPSKEFRRDALLRRFDGDGNGRLDDAERRAVRAAYGDRDVPMLPWPPARYTGDRLPDHVSAARLAACDNTPADNPLTDAGAALGRVLFYDRQLSRNGTIACASCHLQERGFADPRRYSLGFAGGATRRNAMGLANLRYSQLNGARPGFFWDERAPTLEAQVLMPIQDEVEMGMTLDALEDKLQRLPYYPAMFEAAFGDGQVSRDRVARAVAQFMRSMLAFDAPFDRAASAAGATGYAADFDEFTPQENLGKSLFINGVGGIAEIGCAHCHVPPTFGMPRAMNNGLDRKYADRGLGALALPPNEPFTPSNDGKFKAPSLRNIELTAPYMHDGRFATLEQVVEHYSGGVQPHENLGLAFAEAEAGGPTSGFGLDARQKAALVAFLKTLTDRRLGSDPRFSDPFLRACGPAE